MGNNVIVLLEDVVKEYHLGRVVVPALRGVNLKIQAGEFSIIAGPSGSGKTTLLNLIGCVDTATKGKVVVAGESTGELRERRLTRLRLFQIGFIFQSFNLIAVLSAFQNVEFPLLIQRKTSKKERRARVESLLEKVGLADYIHHRPGELSGGQRQRVAIARALVTQPRLVLADEPTANLDSATGVSIIELMKRINEQDGTTFLFSTHDPHDRCAQVRLTRQPGSAMLPCAGGVHGQRHRERREEAERDARGAARQELPRRLQGLRVRRAGAGTGSG